ncbi:SIR2 family protein [Escherichia marmotae]|uniref:SIR2 family protein n=1 Tax=Escherichia ruysiae TaxID=2608867 RepID=UPI001C9A86E4|nr:SIR2 family protein [Escherichia ruysiae]MBY7363565.1 SIR2 family protein [Escherichia ruysiae]MBY7620945.1 SIR2 family protein [Escherichia marmotae]
MIAWPLPLITELAERRCIIFIGSGVSAGAWKTDGGEKKHPPVWKELLQNILDSKPDDKFKNKKQAEILLKKDKYLESAEIIRYKLLTNAEYNSLIENSFLGYIPSPIHEIVGQLDQKIVVTTNFDELYENLCRKGEGEKGYTVIKYYDSGLIARLRSPKRVIIKAHGCVSEPEKTVLTKSDFFKARSENPGFFSALESLFLTHTLLFIGYSITDPEIQLILENNIITYPSDNPHYAIFAKGNHASTLEVFKNINNIQSLEYKNNGDHQELIDSLADLSEKVEERRMTL